MKHFFVISCFNQEKFLHILIDNTIILICSINIIYTSTYKVLVEQKKVCGEIKIYQYAKSAECHFFCTIDSNNHHKYELVGKFKVRPITGHELNWNHVTSKTSIIIAL